MSVYTLTRFYNNGKTEGMIIFPAALNPVEHRTVDTDNYDQYLDEHESYEDAKQFVDDLARC